MAQPPFLLLKKLLHSLPIISRPRKSFTRSISTLHYIAKDFTFVNRMCKMAYGKPYLFSTEGANYIERFNGL